MLGRICLLIYVVVLSTVYSYNKRKKNSIVSNISIFGLIIGISIFFAFRNTLLGVIPGSDYYAYQEWFQYMDFSHIPLEYSNIGFNIFISIIKLVSSSYIFFLFSCGIFIITFMCKFIDYHTEDFCFSMIVYICIYFSSAFNILRQWMACVIILYSIRFIFEKKIVKYILVIIMASMFHPSALFMIILYPVINWKVPLIRKGILMIIVGLIIRINYDVLLMFLLKFSSALGLDYFEKYSSAGDLDLGNLMPFFITFIVSIIVTGLHFKKKMDKFQDKYIPYLYLAVGTTMLNPINIIFNRISVYTFASCIIAIPMLKYLAARKNYNRLIFSVIICIIISFKFIFF